MSFLTSTKAPQADHPTYTGLQIQTSVATLPIPIVMGRARVAPNLIQAVDFATVPHKGQRQGKGGGMSGATSYTYQVTVLMGLCEGPIQKAGRVWIAKALHTADEWGFTIFPGTGDQAPWGYMAATHPEAALAYPWTAYAAHATYGIESPSLSNHLFEIWGVLAGTGINGRGDADPVLCAQTFLTDPRFGAGFPAAAIDATTWFSSPAAQTTGDGSWQTYCRAMGLDLSPCLSSQEPASTTLGRWLQLTGTAAVWSAGLLKMIPYLPQTVTGNGYTYVPNVQPVADLTDRDYVHVEGEDPVQVARIDQADLYNRWRLEFTDSAADYALSCVESWDQALIDDFGLRVASTVTGHEIMSAAVARRIIDLIKARAIYVPLTFSFKLSWDYCFLEAMDLVTLTDPGLGLDRTVVRITTCEEDDEGIWAITAESFPAGLAAPTTTPTQPGSSIPIQTAIQPAPVNAPIIFEPPPYLTAGNAQVWIAASGGTGGVADAAWGGADVYLSSDGTQYSLAGRISAPARMGSLTSALPVSSGNPDAASTLAVSLAISGGTLASGTDGDAAAGRTACYVDGEILSYTSAKLTGPSAYALTGLYRGQAGSAVSAHASGTAFVRLDDAIFRFDLPAAYVGKTLYLKLASVNVFDRSPQDLSTCTAYPYTPTGAALAIGAPT